MDLDGIQHPTRSRKKKSSREKELAFGFRVVDRLRLTIDIYSVCLGPGCSLERITKKTSNGLKLKQRLIEDKRLNILYKETLTLILFDKINSIYPHIELQN